MAESRRVRMKKRLMKDALLELLEVKPLEKITVTDVCAAADVNRSSFYAHYQDIAGLMRELESEVLERIPAPEGADYDEREFCAELERYLGHVRQNARLFRALIVKREDARFNRRLVDAVMERNRPMGEGTAGRYAYVFMVNGVIGLLREWLSEGFPLEEREMAELVLRLCSEPEK